MHNLSDLLGRSRAFHHLLLVPALLFALLAGCSGAEDQGDDTDDAASTGGSGMDASGGMGGDVDSSGVGGEPVVDGTGGETSEPVFLSQVGNPVYELLSPYESWITIAGNASERLAADSQLADNILTWQLPHGGFYKNALSRYDAPWNGSDARSGWLGQDGVELGTIDNQATVTELMFLADVYRRSSDDKYRQGVVKAFEFLLTLQDESGGFPQVYPAREGLSYSNHITFNDDAMIRVLILFDQIVKEASPLGGDLFTAEQRAAADEAISGGVDFILKSQIMQDGVKTVWCAQHDPETYQPRGARSYELPSKSGSESAKVVTFLMTRLQTPEIKSAVQAALAWYRQDDVKFADTAYISRPGGSSDNNYNPITSKPGSSMWCRFYDLAENTCFFSGRLPTDDPPGTGKQYDIMDVEPERRYGYQWGGAYGTEIFVYADSVDY